MNLILNHLNELDQISNYYDAKIYKEINKIEESLTKIIEEKLNKFSIDKKLISSNSIHKELYPFRIISRAKKKKSLEEKFIRKSIKISPNINESLYFDNFDDLIGITIVLDTNRYLIDFKEKLIDETFINDLKVLENDEKKILKKFSDRVPYYNIKYLYKNKYPVEIQIKSALVFEFANLEHRLIYKNHKLNKSIYLSKEIMSSISNNIKAIDDVIIAIENSIDNSDVIEQEITEKDLIANLLKSKYNEKYDILSSYDDLIYYFLKKSYDGFYILNKPEEYTFQKFINENCKVGYHDKDSLPINTLLLLDNINDPNKFLKWFLIKESYDTLNVGNVDRDLMLDLLKEWEEKVQYIINYIMNNDIIFNNVFSIITNKKFKIINQYLLINEKMDTIIDEVPNDRKMEVYMLIIGLYVCDFAESKEEYNIIFRKIKTLCLELDIDIESYLDKEKNEDNDKDKENNEPYIFNLKLLEENDV